MKEAAARKTPPDRPARGARSREHQVAERRRSLLEAALKVIARKGLTGITISDIANEAGCSFGVVSFHFKSKEGIMLAALDHIVDEYDRSLERPANEGNPAGRIRAMIELDFDARVSDADRVAVFTAFWAEAVRNPEYRRRCAELKARYDRVVEAEVTALARARGLDLNVALVARSLNAMVDGLWISNQVYDTVSPSGQKSARDACLFYLKTVFPNDF